jgi:CHRD domain-containing protein
MRSRIVRVVAGALTGAVLLTTGVVALAGADDDARRVPALRLARLTGEKEVPGPGDPNGRGVAAVIVHPAEGRLCFTLGVARIDLPAIGAHVHAGRATEVGPVVVALTPPDATGTSAGCVDGVDRALLRAIKHRPHRYYVNVHTTAFPDGAVRGQLRRP